MKQIVSHLTDGNDGNKREIVRNPSSLAEFGYLDKTNKNGNSLSLAVDSRLFEGELVKK